MVDDDDDDDVDDDDDDNQELITPTERATIMYL